MPVAFNPWVLAPATALFVTAIVLACALTLLFDCSGDAGYHPVFLAFACVQLVSIVVLLKVTLSLVPIMVKQAAQILEQVRALPRTMKTTQKIFFAPTGIHFIWGDVSIGAFV